jgi:lipoate-protein ligase A
VLATLGRAPAVCAPGVECRGTSDLTLAGRKFSGNSARVRRNHLLYHGTLLYDFPLDMVERCLAMPPRMPDYRERRPHENFLVNLPVPAETIRRALADAFVANEPCTAWPERGTAKLVADKYSLPEWLVQNRR